MGEVAFKIMIGNREYPMRVQEENVHIIESISQSLNESIDHHKRNLGLSDIQDAIAMTAFDCMVKAFSVEDKTSLDPGIEQRIATLNSKIEKALS
jgi:cell division protein ZapA (FtsZ GTPase activity inhibitor)